MRTHHISSIVVSIGFACLAAHLTLAQPVITTQPVNQFQTPGHTGVFSVVATGVGLTYQWLFDGTAMVNATNRVFSMPNPQPAQWGYYSVIVSNASGSVTSQVAELKVFVAAPHGFSSIQAASDGSVNLTFKGETTQLFAPYYDLYPLETSTNLVDWAPLATLQRANTALDTLRFVDADAPQSSQRFYRTPKNQLVTPDPQPTGPYPVGIFSMLLTNTLRNNAKFMVTFWYPAVAQAGVLPAKYVDPQVAVAGYYGNFASQAAAFFSHSLSNAPLAASMATCPVVLYDPGIGSHRRENTDKVEDLASWGYVVVGLDTSDTYVSVFPGGTVVYGQTVAGTIAGLDAAIEGRLLDMQIVLDELESLNASDPRLAGRLDLDKIGAFGWSGGGSTVAQLCLRDPRCKAGANMDGPYSETNVLTHTLNVPWLFFRSDFGPEPAAGYFILGNGRPDDRLEVYNKQLTNAYWVRLVSTTHDSFYEYDLIGDSASMEIDRGTPMSGQFLPPARVSQIVRAYLLSFFNEFLRGQNDHLLDGPPPAYPEVMQFLSTANSSARPEYPAAGLVQGSDGNFYGTTAYGGAKGNNGTVFKMTPTGTLTTLVSFDGTNGAHPVAALALGSDGNLYGTTENGGTNGNNGTMFQMTPAGALTQLASFNGTNGSYPASALMQGSDGNFYGTTVSGGASGIGTVFKLTPTGTLTTLVSFNDTNGAAPLATLVQGGDGDFYGTTPQAQDAEFSVNSGGGFGTVFKMTSSGVLTRLVKFNGNNGGNPAGGLVQGSDGSFYGTTPIGGNLSLNDGYGFGTVFKMTTAGVLTTLVSLNLANGYNPSAGLVQGSDGNFYGTTAGGGPRGGGTVFKMTSAGVLTTLFAFNGSNGRAPQALIQGRDGNFYGTTTYGGANGQGTVFQVTPGGALTTLVSF